MKKKRVSGVRFTCQTSQRPTAPAFTPITLASLGIEEPAPLQLDASQELLLNAYMEVEREALSVAFLEEMTEIKNPTKHKELLKLHRHRLKDAQKRVFALR